MRLLIFCFGSCSSSLFNSEAFRTLGVRCVAVFVEESTARWTLVSGFQFEGVDDLLAVAHLTDETFLGAQGTLPDVFLSHFDCSSEALSEATTVHLRQIMYGV